MRGNSAVMTEFDYAVVENTLAKDGQNPIVACISLHGVPGFYGEKVSMLFGKPEAVSSHPGNEEMWDKYDQNFRSLMSIDEGKIVSARFVFGNPVQIVCQFCCANNLCESNYALPISK
jgi:hypothetical protein